MTNDVTKVVLAKLSPTMEEGTIVKWNKKEGDPVKVGDVLAEIETDKANMEMEALGTGVLRKILVPAGGKAPVGALIGVIAEPNEDIVPRCSPRGRRGAPRPRGPRSGRRPRRRPAPPARRAAPAPAPAPAPQTRPRRPAAPATAARRSRGRRRRRPHPRPARRPPPPTHAAATAAA